MTVLVSTDGRRCDESCYNAKRIGCHCICGGRNHGLGLQHALEHQNEYQTKIDESTDGSMDEVDHAHSDTDGDDIEDDF